MKAAVGRVHVMCACTEDAGSAYLAVSEGVRVRGISAGMVGSGCCCAACTLSSWSDGETPARFPGAGSKAAHWRGGHEEAATAGVGNNHPETGCCGEPKPAEAAGRVLPGGKLMGAADMSVRK